MDALDIHTPKNPNKEVRRPLRLRQKISNMLRCAPQRKSAPEQTAEKLQQTNRKLQVRGTEQSSQVSPTYQFCHRAERPGVTCGVAVQEGGTHLDKSEQVSSNRVVIYDFLK